MKRFQRFIIGLLLLFPGSVLPEMQGSILPGIQEVQGTEPQSLIGPVAVGGISAAVFYAIFAWTKPGKAKDLAGVSLAGVTVCSALYYLNKYKRQRNISPLEESFLHALSTGHSKDSLDNWLYAHADGIATKIERLSATTAYAQLFKRIKTELTAVYSHEGAQYNMLPEYSALSAIFNPKILAQVQYPLCLSKELVVFTGIVEARTLYGKEVGGRQSKEVKRTTGHN